MRGVVRARAEPHVPRLAGLGLLRVTDEADRLVGQILREVVAVLGEVRLVDEKGEAAPRETAGEIEVRGPTVFAEYWQRPDETRAAFRNGWFCTGDMAVIEDGSYRLLGRTAVDIIKTGGFKVSALEIEEVLRTHPAIAECAVVGVDDPEWGQRVAVAVELAEGHALTPEALSAWAGTRLAPYKVPRSLLVMARLPRNAMGKVTKPELAALFGP